MNPQLLNVLEDIGLSTKEAQLYLALLQAGPSRVVNLSRAAGLKRTTVYPIIDSLREKGLVRQEYQGLKKLYTAVSPERLEALIEERRNNFKRMLPQFHGLYNAGGGSTSIRCYEGYGSIKSLYEEILERTRAGDFYYAISNAEKWQSGDPGYYENFKLRRKELRCDVRLLLENNREGQRNLKQKERYQEQVKLLPKATKLSTTCLVVPWAAITQQTVEPVMAFVVEAPAIIAMQKEFFQIMWASS